MEGKVRKLTSCARSCLVAFVINAKITDQGELHHVAVPLVPRLRSHVYLECSTKIPAIEYSGPGRIISLSPGNVLYLKFISKSFEKKRLTKVADICTCMYVSN